MFDLIVLVLPTPAFLDFIIGISIAPPSLFWSETETLSVGGKPKPKDVRAIKRIIVERNTPRTTHPKFVPTLLAHPHGLRPIHDLKEPISVDYNTDSRQVVKRRRHQPGNPRPSTHPRTDLVQPRKRHKLIDDSAIESNGEGGDIGAENSTPTCTATHTPPRTPPRTPPTSPPRLPPTPTKVYRIPRIPDPEKRCAMWNTTANSKKQFEKHLASKKHFKNLSNFESDNPHHLCSNCDHIFDNHKNLKQHKCKNFQG